MNTAASETASPPENLDQQRNVPIGASEASAEKAAAPAAAAPAELSRAELESQLAAANAELAAARAKADADEAEEVLIAAKMRKGLKREQAAAAVRRQRNFDESNYGKMVKARYESRQAFSSRH